MSLPVLLTAKSAGVYASPQSTLGAIMGRIRVWPTVSWRRKSKQELVRYSSSSNNNSSRSAAASSRQLQLQPAPPLTRRRSQSRSARDEAPGATRPRRSSKKNSSAKPPLPLPVSRQKQKQNQLRRAARAANAQLSSELMAQKLEAEERTVSNNNDDHNNDDLTYKHARRDDDEINYEMDEDELTTRFYDEVAASQADEDEDDDTIVDGRKRVWRAKQLELERQVAALVAENQAKSALLRYVLDETSRLVSDCESSDEGPHEWWGPSERVEDERENQEEDDDDNEDDDATTERRTTMIPTAAEAKARAVQGSRVVPAAKRKLMGQSRRQMQRRESRVSVAANEAAFEGLVREIEAEFAALFAAADSVEC